MTASKNRIPTVISPDILDTIGKSFKFKHAKGIAEWLKNSLDNYLRLREQGKEPRTGNWPIFVNLIDATTSKSGPNLSVIDFGGASLHNVESFLLNWGSRTAATLGGATSMAAVTGGHGNGGKFYMREMWRNGARFLTWRDGKATSLIVDKKSDGTTGQWEVKDVPMSWREALELALPSTEGLGGADDQIKYMEDKEQLLISELDAMQRGLTVLVGRRGVQVYTSNDVISGGRWNFEKLVEEMRDAPQARRPIREMCISVFSNGTARIARLQPEAIEDDPEWVPREEPLPLGLIQDASLAEGATTTGIIRVRKSGSQLTGRLKYQNSMFIIDGSGNPIAFYSFKDIPMLPPSPLLSFLYAELELTFPKIDALVENDREKLVTSATTEAILSWIGEYVWSQLKAIEEEQKDSRHHSELQIAALLNDALNQHAKRFLQELQTSIMIDLLDDPTGGGPGGSGTGASPVRTGEGKHDKTPEEAPEEKGGGVGSGGTLEVPGQSQPVRRPKFPQVLLSGIDADPAKTDGTSKVLTDRHPPLEQDDVDKEYNVWWINTEHPFAKEAVKHGGAKGSAFKSHQFFMFRDVIQREGLRILQRRESELPLDYIENSLSEFSNRFLTEIPIDLIEELLS
jgi:hypothetical protein